MTMHTVQICMIIISIILIPAVMIRKQNSAFGHA